MTTEIVSPFRTSSYSDQQGDCLEVAHTADHGRAVRDTKDRGAGTQFFGPAAWSTFVAAVKDGHRIA
ncbi:DUF397 domain-containing protein [Streptomyces sp. NPDC057552]|uniref:DUF397 domain-containing protein n=1 Tax=unclassified Streptomyces TaxID=2593676 RepID=UPI0036859746